MYFSSISIVIEILEIQSGEGTCLYLRTVLTIVIAHTFCAYVLRILRYSDFLSVMLTNTGIFLRGLELSGESTS